MADLAAAQRRSAQFKQLVTHNYLLFSHPNCGVTMHPPSPNTIIALYAGKKAGTHGELCNVCLRGNDSEKLKRLPAVGPCVL